MTVSLQAYQDNTISDIISLAENGKSLMLLPACIRPCEMAKNTFLYQAERCPCLILLHCRMCRLDAYLRLRHSNLLRSLLKQSLIYWVIFLNNHSRYFD